MGITKLKFLYVVNSSSFFCSHFITLAKSVFERGNSVYVIAGDEDKKSVIEQCGFVFKTISLSRSGMNPIAEVYSIMQLRHQINLVRPDVLHLFTIKPIIYAGLALKLSFFKKQPIVCYSITGLGSSYLSNSLFGRTVWHMIKSLYRVSFSVPGSIVILENKDDKLFFVEQGIVKDANTFLVDGAGIDTSKYVPSLNKNTTVTVVLVARLLKDKGIAEYIEAGRILKECNVDVCLQLVGSIDDGNISSMSQEDVDFAHQSGFVEYLGHRTDIQNIYASAHVACLPSYREGLPKSLIEAASCGLPLITTDVPGCRQMISNDNGILIEAKSATSIANAVITLVNNPELRKAMGLRSRSMALEKLDFKHIINSYFKIYKLP